MSMKITLGMLAIMILGRISVAAEVLTYRDFLQKVQSNNLDLKIESAKSESTEAKSVGVAIPPPMIGATQLTENSGHVANGIEVTQTIPFPTKLSSDSNARKFEAQSQKEAQAAKSLEILAEAKFLYFLFWVAHEKLNILHEKKQILEDHIRLARATARSDSLSGIHQIRAETDLDLLENDILSAEQNLQTKQVDIATFLNLNADSFKMTPEEPPLREIPLLPVSNESSQIKALTLSLESFKARESEAKNAWFPDFNFRYLTMSATSMAGPYNQVTVGVSLPFLFPWEPNSAANSAKSERLLKEYEVQKMLRTVESNKMSLLQKAQTLRKQLDNLKGKILPKTERRVKLAHNIAPRDLETLQDHREAMEAFPELKMKALEIRMNYEETISSLEKYGNTKRDSHD